MDYCRYIEPNDDCTEFPSPEVTSECTYESTYLYAPFEYDSTAATYFDLVCDNEFKVRRVGRILFRLGIGICVVGVTQIHWYGILR